MRVLLVVVAVVQVALGGTQFSVRMPFLNPAGVTYVEGPAHSGLAAGPVGFGYSAPAQFGYAGQAVAAPVAYTAHQAPLAYATHQAPLAYAAHQGQVAYAHQAPLGYAAHAAPLAYAAPAVGYAHAKVPAVAEVPTVHHVPGVADVPVTRVQANHGVIQKIVDVAHPATATRKFEVRRPAIQKQFYDIEERVIVRNAGSALVELEEPLSKAQKGPTVIARQGAHVLAPVQPIFVGSTPTPPVLLQPTPAPFVPVAAPEPPFNPAQPPANEGPNPPPFGSAPTPSFDAQDDDTVVVGSADFASARAQQRFQSPNAQQRFQPSNSQQRFQQQQQMINAQQQELQARQAQLDAEVQQEQEYQSRRQFQEPQQQPNFARGAIEARQGPLPRGQPQPFPEVRSNGAPLDLIPQARGGPSVVPSFRNSPEVNQVNQQRLIQLLTAQGGVTEVGQSRSGPAGAPVGDAGQVRARVLSATPAPPQQEPAGERVSTRRVVVSRPIETVQEFDVVEPATKVERVAVNHPTVYKTVHHELARVPTSVPVLGKALAHTYAHAAVPVGFHHY